MVGNVLSIYYYYNNEEHHKEKMDTALFLISRFFQIATATSKFELAKKIATISEVTLNGVTLTVEFDQVVTQFNSNQNIKECFAITPAGATISSATKGGDDKSFTLTLADLPTPGIYTVNPVVDTLVEPTGSCVSVKQSNNTFTIKPGMQL